MGNFKNKDRDNKEDISGNNKEEDKIINKEDIIINQEDIIVNKEDIIINTEEVFVVKLEGSIKETREEISINILLINKVVFPVI